MLSLQHKASGFDATVIERADGGRVLAKLDEATLKIQVRDRDDQVAEARSLRLDDRAVEDNVGTFVETREEDDGWVIDVVFGDKANLKSLAGIQVHSTARDDYGLVVKARTAMPNEQTWIPVSPERLEAVNAAPATAQDTAPGPGRT